MPSFTVLTTADEGVLVHEAYRSCTRFTSHLCCVGGLEQREKDGNQKQEFIWNDALGYSTT